MPRQVHAALRGATCSSTGLKLPALAKETGVSVARFERLVEAVAEADAEDFDAPLPGHRRARRPIAASGCHLPPLAATRCHSPPLAGIAATGCH